MSDSTANTILAVAAVAQLVGLVIAAWIAWRQVTEAAATREAETRPYVGIDFQADIETLAVNLVVTNYGRSMATDVTFEFDPLPESTIKSFSIDKMKMLRDGLVSLPPGKTLSTVFDYLPERHKTDLPEEYRATVRYRWEDLDRTYSQSVDLDLGIYKDLTHITRQGLHDIHKRLKDMKDEMRKWTASPRGLLALSLREQRRQDEEFMEWHQERLAAREAQAQTEEGDEDADEAEREDGDLPRKG